jgi:hypothetical protein
VFQEKNQIVWSDVAELFDLNPRTAKSLCEQWVNDGFLVVVDASKNARKYRLKKSAQSLLE